MERKFRDRDQEGTDQMSFPLPSPSYPRYHFPKKLGFLRSQLPTIARSTLKFNDGMSSWKAAFFLLFFLTRSYNTLVVSQISEIFSYDVRM